MHVIKNAANEYFTGDRFSPHQRNARRYDKDMLSRCAANDDSLAIIMVNVFGAGVRLVHLRPHGSQPSSAEQQADFDRAVACARALAGLL